MECEATPSEDVLKVARAPEFSAPVPSKVVPSMKFTEPVGTVELPAGPVTVAVKVTD